MRSLYFECYSGISGDMAVAALLDLGADKNVLLNMLESLPLNGYRIEIKDVFKSGIKACDFNVILDEELDNHDHDMEYLHGHEHHHEVGEHHHEAEGHHHAGAAEGHVGEHHHEVKGHHHARAAEGHVGEHHHEAEGHHHAGAAEGHVGEHHHEVEGHHHSHRGLREVTEILEGGSLTENALNIARSIFNVVAEAEAKAHGTDIENVHFHEVGAVDSIIDIAAFAICLDNLGIEDIIVPVLYEGRGTVRCQHGILPVPVPAVSNIVESYKIKLHMTELSAELVTPTGAAIVAAVRTGDRLPESYIVERTGCGAGKREYNNSGILRAMIIQSSDKAEEEYVCRLESDIDDCSGEMLGTVMDRLMENGAREVHFTPIFMKKNRPAYELVVICMPKDITGLENIIFKETTTIGIRRVMMERTVLERQAGTVETEYGEISVKICTFPDKTIRKYPEYSSVRLASEKHGVSFIDVYKSAIK